MAVEQKQEVDLIKVIQIHVRLTKRGPNYWGLCPFHQEDSPSFTVNPQDQYWHCFGCGRLGYVAEFIQLIDRATLSEALTTLNVLAEGGIPRQWQSVIPRSLPYPVRPEFDDGIVRRKQRASLQVAKARDAQRRIRAFRGWVRSVSRPKTSGEPYIEATPGEWALAEMAWDYCWQFLRRRG